MQKKLCDALKHRPQTLLRVNDTLILANSASIAVQQLWVIP